jgi:hypothetical protein
LPKGNHNFGDKRWTLEADKVNTFDKVNFGEKSLKEETKLLARDIMHATSTKETAKDKSYFKSVSVSKYNKPNYHFLRDYNNNKPTNDH